MTITVALLAATAVVADTEPARAEEPATRAFNVLAGPAWDKARYFEFTLAIYIGDKLTSSYPQRWDRVTGEYRVSGHDLKGNEFVAVMNTNTRKGRAWLNGEEVRDSRRDDTLALALSRFTNDNFWLLMPLKMFDPRFQRTPEGERTDSCGRTWDLIKVTAAGTTPSDQYWAWINRDTGIVEEWDMKLQASKPEEPPVAVMFHDYGRYGGLLISTRREIRNKNQVVRLEGLKVLSEVPKGAFEK